MSDVTLEDRFREWFCGDEIAVNYANAVWDAAQQWDDLEDEGGCADHNALLEWLAIGKNAHPFHMRAPAALDTALLMMVLSWRAANVLDHDPVHIEKAYMLRATIYQVFHLIAWIVGGPAHAHAIGPDIYREYSETVTGLREEMGV